MYMYINKNAFKIFLPSEMHRKRESYTHCSIDMVHVSKMGETIQNVEI